MNTMHKKFMCSLCDNEEDFKWEDTDLIDFLKGKLPLLRNTSSDPQVVKLYNALIKEYDSYNFFESDSKTFISAITKLIDDIRKVDMYWSGISIPLVEETIKIHKGCLISGEGGIGKSYFVKCLEEELEIAQKKHLCLYGKLCPNIQDIDFSEIASVAQAEEFVFIFDAINEIDKQSQIWLADEIKKIMHIKGLRVIITYRTHTIDDEIIDKYQSVVETNYKFAGVSFESAIEWLQKRPIKDINEYVDVLYTNNPFLLSKLPYILDGEQDCGKNNVCRFTYIYEQFIKKSLNKQNWEKTKKVSKFLYENNKKSFSISELATIIDNSVNYVADMEQQGFISRYRNEEFAFVIESLADYLIVRHMWKEIAGKSEYECSQIIKQKIEDFYSLNSDTVILMIFDKFYPDYSTIKNILIQTDLLSRFDYDTLLKIHFNAEDISDFLRFFTPSRTEELFISFAGYANKPFNCTNYLNDYYFSDVRIQTEELSKQLSGKYFFTNIQGRLKNILYFTCRCTVTQEIAKENMYTAIWCSASCNLNIRNLAIKLLFEVIQRNHNYIQELIEVYKKIDDDYIKDAIIYVLSSCGQSVEIIMFFRELLKNYNFLMAKSIKRICTYLGKPHNYINIAKRNLYLTESHEISDDFINILHWVDLMEKDLLPFRFWGINNVEMYRKFLVASKYDISRFNEFLNRNFTCVKYGLCNGNMHFKEDVEKMYSISSRNEFLENVYVLSSLEKVFRDVFTKYGVSFEYEKGMGQNERDFPSSVFRKCVCISIDVFFGSLMCNYYTSGFSTYNDPQDSIGYKVYDPIEYRDELRVKSPLPIFQTQVEKMGDKLVSRVQISSKKDEKWWKNLDITKENIMNMLQPFLFDGNEWLLLAGRLALRDSPKKYTWRDTYNIFACSSSRETLMNDGEERYLTIEIGDYNGNLLEYKQCTEKPWLCKSVPTIENNSMVFDESILVLPPAEIISVLELSLNLEEMSWYDSNGDKIICCNNNKASYYENLITGAVFIRKDAYEKFIKYKPIKFFVFAEKLIENRGYCNDTAFHFEIVDGKFIKEIPNYCSNREPYIKKVPEECQNCKYGFDTTEDFKKEHEMLINIIKKYGLEGQ